ncbi:hypothetical protein HK100_007851 [Physocladia obscura]|uniref:Magnesium transporter n=1 Tax=Physocladia obscura TaxID=109957 RepID=A0AAD5XAH6_9FUNG|nr:hypothetical protein HK100_007851 [Physocladia obscura]
MWWAGLILMALGEICNFGAYAFVPAILVTPLGALSVAISAVLSSVFLDEKLNFSGKIGCAQCVIGATIIVLNAPSTSSANTIPVFFNYVVAPGFLVYSGVAIFLVLYLIQQVSPRYGAKYPIVYISICSMVGSFLVVSIQGFVIFAVVAQIHFLNKALNKFSTAIVTPVYYVFFTTTTLVTSAILFRGFPVDGVLKGAMIVIGFLVIVGGVALLFEYNSQMVQEKNIHLEIDKECVAEENDDSEISDSDEDEMLPEEDSESEDEDLLGLSDDEELNNISKWQSGYKIFGVFDLKNNKKIEENNVKNLSLKKIAEQINNKKETYRIENSFNFGDSKMAQANEILRNKFQNRSISANAENSRSQQDNCKDYSAGPKASPHYHPYLSASYLRGAQYYSSPQIRYYSDFQNIRPKYELPPTPSMMNPYDISESSVGFIQNYPLLHHPANLPQNFVEPAEKFVKFADSTRNIQQFKQSEILDSLQISPQNSRNRYVPTGGIHKTPQISPRRPQSRPQWMRIPQEPKNDCLSSHALI